MLSSFRAAIPFPLCCTVDQHRSKRAHIFEYTSLILPKLSHRVSLLNVRIIRGCANHRHLEVHLCDVTAEVRRYWKRVASALPAVEDLSRYLDTPLPETAKVPVEGFRFYGLLPSPMYSGDGITRQDLELIIRLHDTERAEILFNMCFNCIMKNPPSHDATKEAFHSFWDFHFRNIVEDLIPYGVSFRSSNHHTSTGAFRPDFGFLYLNVCPFRGEERSPTNNEDGRAKLADNMTWTYDPAPYVLGLQFYLFFACAQALLPYTRLLCKGTSGDPCCHLSPAARFTKATNR